MNNELGELLKKLRSYNSLRTIAKKTKNEISFSLLDAYEKGINPNNEKPIKYSPKKLKVLSDVYNYQYEKLLILAGYLEGEELPTDKATKLFNQYLKLSNDEKEKFMNLIDTKK